MTAPVIPISETGYLVRQDSGLDHGEADRPLDAHMLRHQVAANLGHVWDSSAQHVASAYPHSGKAALHTFTGSNVAAKSGNDAYTYFRTVVFPVRLCPDGRPEPFRVLVSGSTSGSNIWIRAVLRWALGEPAPPWPLSGSLRDGWNVGQAVFSSSTQTEKEVDSVVSATEQYGILQFPPGLTRYPHIASFEQEGGVTLPDEADWEPSVAALAAIDFYGGFVSGTSGTGSFWAFLIRGCSYGLKVVDS